MLASIGEITDPCPVPLSLTVTTPSSRMPAFNHFWNQTDNAPVADPVFQETNQPFLADLVEERPDVGVQDVAHLLAVDPDTKRIERVMRSPPRPESVREPEEVFLIDRVQQRGHRPLDDLVLKSCDRERALTAIRLGNVDPPGRQCPIRSPLDPVMQILDILFEVCLIVLPRQPIYAGGRVLR